MTVISPLGLDTPFKLFYSLLWTYTITVIVSYFLSIEADSDKYIHY